MDGETPERNSTDLCESTLPQQILGPPAPLTIFEEWRRLTSYPDYAVNNMGEVYHIGDRVPMPWWWVTCRRSENGGLGGVQAHTTRTGAATSILLAAALGIFVEQPEQLEVYWHFLPMPCLHAAVAPRL